MKFISPAILGLVLTANAHAASIVYAFDAASGAPTSNDFGSGISSSTVSLGGGMQLGNGSQSDSNNASVKLGQANGADGSLAFTVTIPNGVTVNLTNLAFDYNWDSTTNGSGADVFYGWTLGISIGSAATSSADYFVNTGSVYVTNNESTGLIGLDNLTDTTVTFTLTGLNGTDSSYNGGNANNRRTLFDNIELTGAVVPEPGSALLLGLGSVLFLRRRRK